MPFDTGQILAIVQTAALVVTMIGQIYVMATLRGQMRDTARGLHGVLEGQQDARERMSAIEALLDHRNH